MAEMSDVMTFLVIDEDRFTRAYLRSTLGRRSKVRILEAETALKGLDILSHTPVDAVVMDLLVSDFDGLALLELIRSHPGSARAHIIVGSSQASEEMVRRAQKLGVGDYFVKPLQSADIEKRLSALVQRVEKSRRLTSGPDGEPQKQRIVVADNDRNFCAFANTTLATHYDVKHAVSSLGIVALVNSWSS